MTTIQAWIDASLKIMEDNVEIMREWFEKDEIDLTIEQGKALQKHLISFIGYLEMKRKSG